jgi:hypothetical protein
MSVLLLNINTIIMASHQLQTQWMTVVQKHALTQSIAQHIDPFKKDLPMVDNCDTPTEGLEILGNDNAIKIYVCNATDTIQFTMYPR